MISRRALFVRMALALASIAAALGGASRADVAQARRRRRRRDNKTYQY
jgi:hypothetical protein